MNEALVRVCEQPEVARARHDPARAHNEKLQSLSVGKLKGQGTSPVAIAQAGKVQLSRLKWKIDNVNDRDDLQYE